MLRKFNILFLILILLPFVESSIVVSPSSWTVEANKDTSVSQNFVFSQTESNLSSSLSFSKTNDPQNFLNLSLSSAFINFSEPITLTATLIIPSNAVEGTSVLKLKYDSSEIPIVLTVKKNDTVVENVGKCRLEPFPDSYTLPFVSGAPPITQQFSVLVSKHCEEEINIKTPVIIGNTQTKDGQRPLNLFGGSSLGFTEPNQEGTFDVQIDASGLPTGTYKPQILINGIYKGEQLQTKILFTIEVRQGASPLESVGVLPTYILSASDLSLNNTYTITAQNLNPNYEPFVDVDPSFIRGIKVETGEGWTYSFQPTNVGSTKIKVMTRYAGAPIGDVTEKEVRITYGGAQTTGTKMCFDFFAPEGKSVDALNGGDEVTVLVRSTNSEGIECNRNGTIINNVDIYKNGGKMDINKFSVNAGETVVLSASAPGFISIDRTVVVPLSAVQISYSTPNNDVEIGSPLTIITNPSDAEITLNGQPFNGTITPNAAGTLSFIATKQGYKQSTLDLSVTPILELLNPEIPSKIKMNQPFTLDLNKNAQWSVIYSEKKNATGTLFASSTSSSIQFSPTKKGYYKVYLRDKLIKEYKVGNLFGLTLPKQFWWGVGILVGLFVLFKMFSSRGEKSQEGAGFEFNPEERQP